MPGRLSHRVRSAEQVARGVSRRLSLRARIMAGFAAATMPFVAGLIVVYADAGGSPADLRRAVVVSLLIGVCVCAVVTWRLGSAAIRPMRQAVAVLQQAADGDLRPRLVGSRRLDEFGELARALNLMLDNAAETFFAVGSRVRALSTTSTKLAGTAEQLASSADNTSVQSTNVSYAADQVSINVITVASGSAQMEGAIRDIAENADRASTIAAEAAATAASVTDTTQASIDVRRTADEIGDVVGRFAF